METTKRPRIVGDFIRRRREALGISQRALGLLFSPPVTTQFISNVERGVTPLPPAHVPTLTKALMISEGEILELLEKEFTYKLSGRMRGVGNSEGEPSVYLSSDPTGGTPGLSRALPALTVEAADFDFIRGLYDAYRRADPKTQQAFATVCESILKVKLAQKSSLSVSGETDKTVEIETGN
jgi:transcriptional regulator with XRE-family HTH domain